MSVSANSGDLSRDEYRIAANELVNLFSGNSIIVKLSEDCIKSMNSGYISMRKIVIEGDILQLRCAPNTDKTIDSTSDGHDSIDILDWN